MRVAMAAGIAAVTLLITGSAASSQQSATRPPDGMYVYRWNNNGALAGQSIVTIQTTGTIISVQTTTNLTNLALANASITFGSALELQSYRGTVSNNGLDASAALILHDGAVTGTVTSQSPTSQPLASRSTNSQSTPAKVDLPRSALGAVFAVDDGAIGTLPILPAQINARGARSFQIIPVPLPTTPIGVTSFSTSQAGPYPTGTPTTDTVATFNATTLWYDPHTLIVDRLTQGPLTATLLNHP